MYNTDMNVTMSVVLNEKILEYLRERASQQDRSVSAELRRILEAVMAAEPVQAEAEAEPAG